MARYSPAVHSGQRIGARVIDPYSPASGIRDAFIQSRVADIRRMVEARIDASPFSGRRSFGRIVGGELCGRESLEWEEGELHGQGHAR